MPYITSIEPIGREEGRDEEHEQRCQTLRKLILNRQHAALGRLGSGSPGPIAKGW